VIFKVDRKMHTMIEWRSEEDALPKIGQSVLLASLRQLGEYWDLSSSMILVKHEGVVPRPIRKGSAWPTDFWWGDGRDPKNIRLITGNAWWASWTDISLPPGAVHKSIRGYDVIEQIGTIFIPQNR